LKTSQLAAWIQGNEPKLFFGSGLPFVPLRPELAGRTKLEAGWLAFQLIRQVEYMLKMGGNFSLAFNDEVGAFMVTHSNVLLAGWKVVHFDGYGPVDEQAWMEVAR
jgi:hypothetical protein